MNKQKENFKFEYVTTSLDWYEIKKIEIGKEEYTYFKLEKRFGPHLWLIGMKYNEKTYEWKEKDIGEIQRRKDLKEFIEWAKDERTNRLIEIRTISGSLDIMEVIKEIIKAKEEG